VWLRAGERMCAEAPQVPGVYVLRDADGRALYVGKANNIRRRLRTHFAARRWPSLKPQFARAVSVECHAVGSEIEALLCEAEWIRDLLPTVNVQVGAPTLGTRAVPLTLLRDTIVVLPSAVENAVELLAACVSGGVRTWRLNRDGAGLASRATELRRFFKDQTLPADHDSRVSPGGFAPLVFSWLAGRGRAATRLDPHDAGTAKELERRLRVLIEDDRLFTERIVVLRSGFRSASQRALSSAG
jgi:predicted GIY-YIG superfamily endonuclease